ncbi:MAG TPA: secretin N-terminal domain-containing protein, partial [Candidatus Ozemobacteraceae bacterium]|nr:secretin N-terminal domain-containing protein [Candidatus Ozemobacteraceae bacterium]
YLSSVPELSAQNAPAGAVSAPVELVLNDTSLGSALQIMAEQAGKKFEAHVPLEDKVNLDLRGLSFEDAVARVMAGKPYMYALDNETLHVFKGTGQPAPVADVPVVQAPIQPQVQMAPPVVEKPKADRIFILKNRKAEELVVILKQLASEVGLVPDVRTNTILIKGFEEDVDRVASLAAQLDGMEPVRELEDKREYLSEVFSLEYVNDFADLENNLNMILYGQRGQGQGGQTTGLNQQMTTGGINQQYQEQMGETKPIPVRKEYYLLDKVRRVLMITAARDKMEIIREYFTRVNTPIAQVQIEAHIVAIDAGFERSLGINWNFQGGYTGPARPTANPLGIPQSTQQAGNNTNVDPTQGFEFGMWNLSNLSFVLQSAESQNKGRILSQPRVMTLSGNEASIQIGTKYPYKQSTTQSNVGTTENVNYVDVGIILNVTPQVNSKARSIVMKLHPEVSDVLGFRNDAPIITTRQTDTTVEV